MKPNPTPEGKAITMSEDLKCIHCDDTAVGRCENCNAPICPDHEAGEYDDVYTCKDAEACEIRLLTKSL